MPSKRFHSGQPLGAVRDSRWLNYVNEGAELAHGGRFGQSDVMDADPRTTVLVRNDNGEDVPRFGVLGINSVLITPTQSEDQFQNHYGLVCDAPDEERDGPGRIAITLVPLGQDKLGPAVLSGVVPVKISLPDAEMYKGAKFVTGDTTRLEAENSGDIVVLWHEQGPGLRWALVHLGAGGGGGQIFRTRPTEEHAPDTVVDHQIIDTDESGTATVRPGDPIASRNETGAAIAAGDDCHTYQPDGSEAYFSFPWETGCASAHELSIAGNPVAGTFEWRYQIETTNDDLEFDFDSTAAEAQTVFEGHSAISVGQVEVVGGPLPHVALYVSFIDIAVTATPVLIGNLLSQDVDDPFDPQPKLRLRA